MWLTEQVAHLQVGDALGREVDIGGADLLDDKVEAGALIELVDFGFKLKFFKDVAGARREAADIDHQIAGDVGRGAQQFFKGEGTYIV